MKTRNLKPGLILLAFLLSFALAACSGVLSSEQPPRQHYLLMPYAPSPGAGGAEPGPSLLISVSAVPGLDTDRILALSNDARLNRYANARWPDYLPEVLSSVMKRSLDSSGLFLSVEVSGQTADGGWAVQLEVQQFYGIQNSSGDTRSVIVEMAGNIECESRSKTLKLSASNPVAEERLSAVVVAHQRGLNDVTRQLLDGISELCF